MYIVNKKIGGCIIAESIKEGYPIINTINTPINADTTIDNNHTIRCSKSPKLASIGISHIWVNLPDRRKGIATKLLDTVRYFFIIIIYYFFIFLFIFISVLLFIIYFSNFLLLYFLLLFYFLFFYLFLYFYFLFLFFISVFLVLFLFLFILFFQRTFPFWVFSTKRINCIYTTNT